MCSEFVCSSGAPQYLLSVHDDSPCRVHKQTGLTPHTSLSPPEVQAASRELRALCSDNTNHQNLLFHKSRLRPSGYALVNRSITLKPLGPAVVQTQTHIPHSQNHKHRVETRLQSCSSQACTRTQIMMFIPCPSISVVTIPQDISRVPCTLRGVC